MIRRMPGRMLGAIAMAASLAVALPVAAQTPEPAKPPAAQPGMQRGMPHHGDMARNKAAGHHRRSCFDAAWQSEEWKRCEAMMERRRGGR